LILNRILLFFGKDRDKKKRGPGQLMRNSL